ncbi:MAG: DUF362 domain-containing protein [Candidatus Omnitrophica bacterium]|nr:DUF362 domain-containing protein [Candidatus Omnitrophota bacterium]
MKSKVYIIRVSQEDNRENICAKLNKLIDSSKVLDFLKAGQSAALKMHFGEVGNAGYVRPEYAGVISQAILKRKAKPFLSDTNTLYSGKRTNSVDHLALAYEHGFKPEVVKARVIIPDDSKSENVKEIKQDNQYVKNASIAKLFWDADAIVGIAHFKGHLMTGFGGALKNLGMGCATRPGKLFQHCNVAPYVIVKNCTACKACIAVCPAIAIALKPDKAFIDPQKCIGCASCLAACKFHAIDVKWESGGDQIQEKIVDFAHAVLSNKKGKAAFFNFCLKITQECDCLAQDDPRIVPDIGIMASNDPVAIDKAGFDLVTKAAGKDIFKELHPKRDGMKQLKYAAKLGLGNLEYKLVEI